MHTPTLIRNFPYASAYILGVFDGDVTMLRYIYHIEGCVEMFRTLNRAIKRYHPDWIIDEVYWRGVDLAEGIVDEIAEGQ